MSCSSSSPSGTPMIQMLERLKLSQRFLSLSSCFWILVSSLCLVECLEQKFLLLQTLDLSPSFLPFTVGSLYILLYFSFRSLHFFLYFGTILNHFLWASWLPVFWTLHLIGWLSLHCLVVFFSGALICSFIWAIFSSCHTCHVVKGGALDIPQGRATHFAVLWGKCLRGNNVTCSALSWLSITSSSTHRQIGPFWCWFPGGWAFVHSRSLWVSPTNGPVSFSHTSTPTGFFS